MSLWRQALRAGGLLLPALLAAHGDSPPAPPPLGSPGDGIVTATVPLAQEKTSAERAEGGPRHMFFSAWMPKGLARARGLYLTPFNLDTVEKAHSRAMAENWGFALVGANFMRVRKDDFLPALTAGLAELAARSGHPELNGAPMIVCGMSAGAGMARTLAELTPGRVIACGLVCLEVGPETEATRDVPMLTVFGEKDGQQMTRLLEKLPLRRGGFDAKWAIAPQWGRQHEWGRANHLLWTFFDEVLRQRLPPGETELRSLDSTKAWLADPATWDSRSAAIAPADAYRGDRAGACWLPGEETAHVWRAFVTPKPRLKILAPEPQGDGKPLAVVPAGTPVRVEVRGDPSLPAGELVLYDRARQIAAGRLQDGKAVFTLPDLAPGFHAFIACFHLDGMSERSHPVTLLVQP